MQKRCSCGIYTHARTRVQPASIPIDDVPRTLMQHHVELSRVRLWYKTTCMLQAVLLVCNTIRVANYRSKRVHGRPIISLRHSGPRYRVRWSRTDADGVHQQRHISAQRDLRSTTPTCSVCTEVNAARARTASAQGRFILSYFLHCLHSL